MRYLKYIINGFKPKNLYYLSSLSLKDYFKKSNPIYSNSLHIKAAMKWLSTAQKQNKDSGVSALYSLFEGWGPSYIETTGYILPTFFNYAEISKNNAYREKAIQMADFELKSQLENGGFEGGRRKNEPVTFNTGQVIFGLCRTYQETKDERYKKAAEKAADLLISAIDNNGCFNKHLYLDNTHTYNTRTAWSLLKVNEISKKQEYKEAAKKNIDWALTQQLDNGWFRNNAFHPEQEPLVHTIAYSIRGILESGIYLKNKEYIQAAVKASAQLLNAQRKDGSLAGSFNDKWKSKVKWSCLTGNSQMSIIWQTLYTITKDKKFMEAAKKINNYMKTRQNLSSSNPGIKGGIPGAFPIYGWYAPFCFTNWAAKFFVDSLMLEENPGIANKLS